MSTPNPSDPQPQPVDPPPDEPRPQPQRPADVVLEREAPAPSTLTREAPVVAADATARTITARFVTYNEAHDVVDLDAGGRRHTYRETHAPGSIVPADRLYVRDRHDGALVGHVSSTRDDPDGFYGDLTIADTYAGRDLMALVDAGTVGAVSMEFGPDGEVWNAGRTAVTRTRSHLYGVAFAFRPAHDAPILAVRDLPAVSTTVDGDPPAPTPTVTATPATDDVDTLRRDLMSLADRVTASTPAGHPLARFRSADAYLQAVWDDPSLAGLVARAMVDQITTDNPGVIPPGWLQQVFGIVDRGRPAITALGPAGLPDAGMDINWPYFAGDLTALVGAQTAEKTPIVSVKVSLLRATTPINTYAGGSDISYQLLRRSSPSYREAYTRIMAAAYSLCTENVFEDALATGGTGHVEYDPVAPDTGGDAFRTALFAASSIVRQVTGAPASLVLASSDQFLRLGGISGLVPPQYGTQNVSGTSSAATLRVSVSGLEVVEGPYLPAGTILVTNDQAASWHGDGPFIATAEDVEKLGQNVAIWGMGAAALYLPAGIVKLSDTTP